MTNNSIKPPSPWVPLSDPTDIKLVGKAIEETQELGKALARALIQGIEGTDPADGKSNRQSLTEEISDVLALVELVEDRFQVPIDDARVDRKKTFLQQWLDMPV